MSTLKLEYFLNIWMTQGRVYSESSAHHNLLDAAAEVADEDYFDYLETLHRHEDGSIEVIDLSGHARDIQRERAA